MNEETQSITMAASGTLESPENCERIESCESVDPSAMMVDAADPYDAGANETVSEEVSEDARTAFSEEKPEVRKKSFRWILSVIGEVILVVPVIVVLLLIGKFFH